VIRHADDDDGDDYDDDDVFDIFESRRGHGIRDIHELQHVNPKNFHEVQHGYPKNVRSQNIHEGDRNHSRTGRSKRKVKKVEHSFVGEWTAFVQRGLKCFISENLSWQCGMDFCGPEFNGIVLTYVDTKLCFASGQFGVISKHTEEMVDATKADKLYLESYGVQYVMYPRLDTLPFVIFDDQERAQSFVEVTFHEKGYSEKKLTSKTSSGWIFKMSRQCLCLMDQWICRPFQSDLCEKQKHIINFGMYQLQLCGEELEHMDFEHNLLTTSQAIDKLWGMGKSGRTLARDPIEFQYLFVSRVAVYILFDTNEGRPREIFGLVDQGAYLKIKTHDEGEWLDVARIKIIDGEPRVAQRVLATDPVDKKSIPVKVKDLSYVVGDIKVSTAPYEGKSLKLPYVATKNDIVILIEEVAPPKYCVLKKKNPNLYVCKYKKLKTVPKKYSVMGCHFQKDVLFIAQTGQHMHMVVETKLFFPIFGCLAFEKFAKGFGYGMRSFSRHFVSYAHTSGIVYVRNSLVFSCISLVVICLFL